MPPELSQPKHSLHATFVDISSQQQNSGVVVSVKHYWDVIVIDDLPRQQNDCVEVSTVPHLSGHQSNSGEYCMSNILQSQRDLRARVKN